MISKFSFDESKFEAPKTEIINKEETVKPVFVQNQEENIPQPPQLVNKPKVEFEMEDKLEKQSSDEPEMLDISTQNDDAKNDYTDKFKDGII